MGILPDSEGCRYNFLIGDQISKWYEAMGMPNQEAKTVAQAQQERQRTSTTSFHLEGNAMIEQTNRTLEESSSRYVSEHQHDWKNYLQLVMMA